MSVEKAVAHYTGKPGHPKLNCAQSVAYAFKDALGVSEEVVAHLGSCGGGRAPEGQCGTLYAAKVILEKQHPDRVQDCEQALFSSAGAITCRDIRALKKLSCAGCVETVAGIIEKA